MREIKQIPRHPEERLTDSSVRFGGTTAIKLLIPFALFIPPGTVLTQAQPPAPGDAGQAYHIPYRLTDTKHLIVRARVNGHGPYNFVMDTGAPDLFLASERAKQAGCEVGADHYASIKTFEIEGGPILSDARSRVEELFQLRSMNAIDAAGVRIDGVMGYTVLARFRVEIDLNRDSMTWTRLAFTPPRPSAMYELTAGQPLKAAKDAKNMEGLAKWASAMFQKKASPPPIARGFLGIEFASDDGPATVTNVFPGGPAERSGLKAGDRITAVKVAPGDPVETPTAALIRKTAAELRPGQTIVLIVMRGSARTIVRVKAEAGVL